jgi:hypothetical protein
MSKIKDITEIFESSSKEDFISLLSSPVMLTEKVSGSRLEFQKRSDGKVDFYNKGVVSVIDRTMISVYEKPIAHIKKIVENIQVPKNYRFGLQYVYEEDNLILTDLKIKDSGDRTKNVISDNFTINKWADLLEVSCSSHIFKGTLEKSKISEVFSLFENGEISISNIAKIYSNNVVETDILFMRFTNEDKKYTITKITDPILDFKRKEGNLDLIKNKRSASDMASISISDMVEYLKINGLDDYKLTDESVDQRYVDLISLVFNDYIKSSSRKYEDVDFDKPEFAKLSEFRVNTKFIKSEETRNLIKNPIYEDLYKIMLGTFKKDRKRSNDVMDSAQIKIINSIILDIQEKIKKQTKIQEGDNVPLFSEYLESKKNYKIL